MYLENRPNKSKHMKQEVLQQDNFVQSVITNILLHLLVKKPARSVGHLLLTWITGYWNKADQINICAICMLGFVKILFCL